MCLCERQYGIIRTTSHATFEYSEKWFWRHLSRKTENQTECVCSLKIACLLDEVAVGTKTTVGVLNAMQVIHTIVALHANTRGLNARDAFVLLMLLLVRPPLVLGRSNTPYTIT